MNGPMIRALLQDALYQVFDNKIFRLLMLLVLAFGPGIGGLRRGFEPQARQELLLWVRRGVGPLAYLAAFGLRRCKQTQQARYLTK